MKRIVIILCSFVSFHYTMYSQNRPLYKEKTLEKREIVYESLFLNNEKEIAIRLRDKIEIFQTDTLHLLHTIKTESNAMDAMSNSNFLAVGDKKGNINIYKSDSLIQNIQTGNCKIQKIRFGPSHELLASVSDDSIVKVWQTNQDIPIAEFLFKEGKITDIDFSLDNVLLFISTSVGKVLMWEYRKDTLHCRFDSHIGYVMSLAVCPDSLRFASCGKDKKLVIYSIRNKDYYCLEEVHRNMVVDIEFLNDQYLLSIGHDHLTMMSNTNKPNANTKNHYYIKTSNKLLGDKYLNNIAISKSNKCIAISTLGKGVTLTNYFHNFIKNSHLLTVYDSNQKWKPASVDEENLFTTVNDTFHLSGDVKRANSIKEIWLYDNDSNERRDIKLTTTGNFNFKVPLAHANNHFSLIIEDNDEGLQLIEYKIRISKE